MRPSTNGFFRSFRSSGGTILNTLLKLENLLISYKNQIFRIENLTHNKSKKLCIFVVFPSRSFFQNDIELLQILKKKEYFVCVVSNGEIFNSEKYIPVVDCIIQRRNIGFDLAAFRDALNYMRDDYDSILLLNDSILWPKENFERTLAAFENLNSETSVIGVTDSYQRGYHLQSYCLFAQNSVPIGALRSSFATIKNFRTKRSAVYYGELKLSKEIVLHGAQLSVLINYRELKDIWLNTYCESSPDPEILELIRKGIHLNPCQHFWEPLLNTQYGFIKKSLLFKNPARLRSLPGDQV